MTGATVALEPDHADLREAVGSICAKYPAEYWRRLEDTAGYPSEFIADLTSGGFLAVLIPEEFGGGGGSLRMAAVILETINRHGCSASQGHAQLYIMATLLRHGSDEQKRRYLPPIASGEMRLQAFAVTEPTTGSDTTQVTTRAARHGDEYVIQGQKVWTSRALHSDLMLLLARTTPAEDCARRSDGLSVFLVDINEARRQGALTISPLPAMINHNTTEVFVDGLRVPAGNLIGTEGQGFRYLLDGLNAERTIVASEAVGDGRFFLDKAVRYAGERVVFGRPIGRNQGIQFPLARAYAELEAADMMARRAAALFDARQPCGSDANIAKLLASEACWHAGEAAMQTHGGFAFSREFDVERKWRECRVYQIAPVSTNMILAHLAQHVLGLPRSY